MPTALDNVQLSSRTLLRAVVARLLGRSQPQAALLADRLGCRVDAHKLDSEVTQGVQGSV
jgi:hypothetical protein